MRVMRAPIARNTKARFEVSPDASPPAGAEVEEAVPDDVAALVRETVEET